ncbi:PD-(D/E)XK nuclease family protein [Thermoflexus sp.]|uniref:PD-(D/E)XK nuclease family protein n=1 Tax=Thermoflexus sp. TaxID=1969742 RepID=UPI002ADDC6F5|nr:DUF3782 domain-containing protein [Thermoflexus sp.]
MSITLDDLPTLLALLDKHPEWREALRAVLLSEELLKMPEELRRLEGVIAKILEAHRLGEEALAAFRMESERRFMELAGALTRLSEMQNRLSEVQARMEERMTRLEERVGHLEERVGRLEEAIVRLIEVQARMEERMTRLEERMIRMEERILRRLNAFGARWGLRSERAWREGMRAVLEEAGFEVERWTDFDERGEVFNFPSDVEVDVVIRNGRVLVVELRTSVSREALPTMERKVRFYEGRTGRKVDRRILVTPWYDPGVDELARRLGWELYGEPEEIQE